MSNEELNNSLRRLNKECTYNAYSVVAGALDRISLDESQLPSFKVAVLRNFTFEPLLPVIKGEIARCGFYPDIYMGPFDAIAQDAFDSQSPLYQFNPDMIIIAQWIDATTPSLTTEFMSLSDDQRREEVKRVVDTTSDIICALRKNCSAPILVNNFQLPLGVTLGILDAQSENYQTNTILKLNSQMLQIVRQSSDVYIVDYMRLMAGIGQEQGADERYWHMGRAPIGRNALVPFGREYGKFISALNGKTRKCLVLDCDNILWGGVIGEDGMQGIKLGTNYPGSCYQSLQKEILNLHDRGVILALCSKNNEHDVLEVLRNHPAMILKEKHFSTWQINWDDKATNIIKIADQLNIGLDSMIFVDDSEFECELVRERLSQVSVLQFSSEPSTFKSRLNSEATFDSLTLSEEDHKRNQMYRDQRKRKVLYEATGSLEDYFEKLDMDAEIGLADETSIQRIAQLTQKTNQFNLTTKRYTEGDINTFAKDSAVDVFYVSLRDRISDMGLIGVGILKYNGKKAEIDTFLLSCRIIGRGIEDAVLSYVLNAAKARGCSQVSGKFIKTKKNGQVVDFYKKNGFRAVSHAPDENEWVISLESQILSGPKWIKINLIKHKEKLCK